MPKELEALFMDGPAELRGFKPLNVVPEWKTYFKDGPWGPRNHDVLMCGFAGQSQVVVGVEVKADERVDCFSRALFGFPVQSPAGDLDPRTAAIPYQLLSGAAGTIVEAAKAGARQAVFIVHVLDSGALDEKKLEANRIGLRAFCELLHLEVCPGIHGWLLGPASYPGASEADGCQVLPVLRLFVGYAYGRC